MTYKEGNVAITTDTNYFSPAGYVTKTYLMDAYPQLSDQVKSAGLWVAGIGNNGYLGTNNTTWVSSPVQTVAGGNNWKLVNAGYYIAAGIKTDGTLWTWGKNDFGQLGTNNITVQSSPVQTSSAGTNWQLVQCGNYSMIGIKTDGTLWCWGKNSNGQLGDGTIASKSNPIQTVAGGTNWKSASSGGSYQGGLKSDGTLWTWGYATNGALGDGTGIDKSSPVQVATGGTNWKQFSLGGGSGSAVKTDGTLWVWGINDWGQLGINNRTTIYSPVQTIAGGTTWKQVSVGIRSMAATKTDGTLWLWGSNTYGNLGDNTSSTGTDKSSPVQTTTGGTNWKTVDGHYSHSVLALKTDGSLWLWGKNSYGQLGLGDRTSRSTPVQSTSGGSNWKFIAAAWGQCMTIRDFNEDL